MYELLLYAHSYLRWAVLIAGAVAVVMAFRGVAGNRAWTPSDRKAQLAYTTAADLQFLLGLLLYFVSPLVQAGLSNFGGSMKAAPVRFFMMEHLVMMVAAITVLHIFAARSKKAPDDLTRHKRWRTGALLSLVLILAAVPWPFLAYGRPLIRF